MAMSDWSEKQLLALTAGVAGGVVLVMAGLVLWVYMRYGELCKEIEAKEKEVQAKRKEAERLDSVRKQLEEISARFNEKRVPPDRDMDGLLRQINEQLARARLTYKGVDYPKETRKGPVQEYEPIPLRLQCEGGYHELGQFISGIEERIERLVAVTGFRINAYKDGLLPGKKALDISLDLEAFRYNEKKPAPAAGAAKQR